MTSEILAGIRETQTSVDEDGISRFYEASILALKRWVIGGGNGRNRRAELSKAFGQEVMEERARLFLEGKYCPGAVDYDENNIPGTWILNISNRQEFFRPLAKVNHLLLAYDDERAAKGLLTCVPGLWGIADKNGLLENNGNDLLNSLRSACLAASCCLETMSDFNCTIADEIALMAVIAPLLGVVWVREKLEGLEKQVRSRIDAFRNFLQRDK